MTWTAAAEAFAEGIKEHGYAAADLVASAWQARCHPHATDSLLAAAVALAGGEAAARAWERVPPCPTARHLLIGTEEIQGEVAGAMQYAQRLGRDCAGVHDAAVEEFERARHAAARANAANAASEAAARIAVAAASERMEQMREVIADTEAAMEILEEAYGRLFEANLLLPQVPVDYEDAYDVPLEWIRDGGTLPWSGDFITPETTMNRTAA